MASYKSTKTQLVAIYRLEFYKKKKNWKLCEDVRKEPSPTPKTKLNETYNVEEFDVEPDYDAEQDYDEEQVSLHNKAFLNEESELQPPASEPPAPPSAGRGPRRPRSRDRPRSGDKSPAIWQGAQQEWCGAEAEGMPEELAYDQCDGPGHQRLWPAVSQYENLEPECAPCAPPLEFLSPSEMLLLAEEWLQAHGWPVLQEEYAPYCEQYGLLDDSADFMRGAHFAPHSSETELSDTHDECACARGASVSRAQLSRGIHAHAAALAALLREHAIRAALYSHTSLHPPIPLDDYPTRDTDPPRPPDCLVSGSHWRPDSAVSGSHRPPDTGRGRGRLHQADRLIGIGMGRPYRL